MKTKGILAVLALVFAFAVLTGFTPDEIKKDFAAFDRAFIPPLALTNQNMVPQSKKGMVILKEKWAAFKAKYYEANPADPKWKSDLDKVEQQIVKADGIVQNSQDLMPAHEALEEIRGITMELRKRNNIKYIMDPMTEFHHYMEEMAHFGADNKPEDVTDKNITDLAGTLAKATDVWKQIMGMEIEKDLFGLSDETVASMKSDRENQMKALEQFKAALEKKDKPAIIQTAKGTKPYYQNMLKTFGDFESIKKS